MDDFAVLDDFELDGRIWLNAAQQGPFPCRALEAARNSLQQKAAPWHIHDEDFTAVPDRLRRAIAALIQADTSEVILGNSASYGIDLLARGLDWHSGDEVLYVEGEFPASVFPWHAAETRDVHLRSFCASEGNIPSADELREQIRPQTRVFICSWVNSFTGHTLDLDAISRVCREAGVLFVLNASQALGARVLHVHDFPIDAITCCGYKWLLGPYATGFCWIDPQLRAQLTPPHAYWLPNVWGRAGSMQSYSVQPDLGCKAFDVFAPANFLNAAPWTAALEYLAQIGVSRIERHNAELVQTFLRALDQDRYELISPQSGERQSAIVVIESRTGKPDGITLEHELAKEGIYASTRNNVLRLSPHLYNSRQDMQRTATLLNNLHSS